MFPAINLEHPTTASHIRGYVIKSEDLSIKLQVCYNFSSCRFFEHLKRHYEPGGGLIPSTPKLKTAESKETTISETKTAESTENERQESLLSSLLNLTCIECNKTFRRQKTFEAHMRDIHTSKTEPLDEFSEPEDLMEGKLHLIQCTFQFIIDLKYVYFRYKCCSRYK